jgi:hypothetical protein
VSAEASHISRFARLLQVIMQTIAVIEGRKGS